MKHVAIRIDTGKGGWVSSTLCPVGDKHEAKFNFIDFTLFVALVVGTVAVARILLAT